MSWGTELWDQYDNLSHHSQKGIDFLEKYGQFMKERSSIEAEYASKLRKLVKNYLPKKKDEDEYQFSSWSAFMKTLNEINDIAGQHEIIYETYFGQISKEIADLTKELKEERKKHLQDGQRHHSALQTSKSLLEKNKKAYEKSFKESEKANDSFQKIDADINLSRADVEKARHLYTWKSRICEESKTDYANQLQKTNDLQRVHYYSHIPSLFQQLQDMEERRISCIQNFIKRTAVAHKQILPIIQKCLDGIVNSAELIDPKQDSLLVIEKFKSGYSPPDDIPFEDFSETRGADHSGVSAPPKTDTIRGTFSSGRSKKRGPIFKIFSNNKNIVDDGKDDFSDLPPTQRRKKLLQKIDAIKSQIHQETLARDGLMKMKGVYEQNPALGDPLSIEGQLLDNGVTLENLQNELLKYQTFLSDPEGMTSIQEYMNNMSEDSLSRSASDSSVSNPNGCSNSRLSAPSTPQQAHVKSSSPESGIGASHFNITDAETDGYLDPDLDFENPCNEYTEFDAILGTGKAIYSFTGQSEGSVDVLEGETFEIVELDQGDGWTRIRKRNNEEGFVPTSYIETYLYNTC